MAVLATEPAGGAAASSQGTTQPPVQVPLHRIDLSVKLQPRASPPYRCKCVCPPQPSNCLSLLWRAGRGIDSRLGPVAAWPGAAGCLDGSTGISSRIEGSRSVASKAPHKEAIAAAAAHSWKRLGGCCGPSTQAHRLACRVRTPDPRLRWSRACAFAVCACRAARAVSAASRRWGATTTFLRPHRVCAQGL